MDQTKKPQGASIEHQELLFIRVKNARNWPKNAGKNDLLTVCGGEELSHIMVEMVLF